MYREREVREGNDSIRLERIAICKYHQLVAPQKLLHISEHLTSKICRPASILEDEYRLALLNSVAKLLSGLIPAMDDDQA